MKILYLMAIKNVKVDKIYELLAPIIRGETPAFSRTTRPIGTTYASMEVGFRWWNYWTLPKKLQGKRPCLWPLKENVSPCLYKIIGKTRMHLVSQFLTLTIQDASLADWRVVGASTELKMGGHKLDCGQKQVRPRSYLKYKVSARFSLVSIVLPTSALHRNWLEN